MITVALHQLNFHAYHGIHEQEKIVGNTYVIDAAVTFHEGSPVVTEITETINYAELYKIIRSRMEKPTPLLETIVMEIAGKIYDQYPQVKSITLSLKKMHPPIEAIEGSAGVSYHKEY